MPISSLIIRTDGRRTQEIAEYLKTLKEATVSEVHNENIILVAETVSRIQDKTLWEGIEKIPGVLQCDLIYHNFEDAEGFKYD